jgi:hypothetical protein
MSTRRGKVKHVLRSHLSGLYFQMEPPFDCADDDSRNVTFIKATNFIRGQDTMEEYLACQMYLLSDSVSYERVTDGVAPVLRLKLPQPKFHAMHKDAEDDIHILARVEMEAEGVVGSHTGSEHDICMAGQRDGDRLNHMFELAGVPYGPQPVPGTDAFIEAMKKRKMYASRKTPVKHTKVSEKQKAESLKIVVPWAKSGSE